MGDAELRRVIKELKERIVEGEEKLRDLEVPDEMPWAEFLDIGGTSPCKSINDPCDSDVFVDLVREFVGERGFKWYEVRDDILEELEDWLHKKGISTWDAAFYLWAAGCAKYGGIPVRLTHKGDNEWELFTCLDEGEWKRAARILECVYRAEEVLRDGEPRKLYEKIVDLLGRPKDPLEAFEDIIYDPVGNSGVLRRIIGIVRRHVS